MLYLYLYYVYIILHLYLIYFKVQTVRFTLEVSAGNFKGFFYNSSFTMAVAVY